MKLTVISLLAVAFLSVGPAGAIPVDGIQDATTVDAVSRTDDAMPSGPSATLTSDKSDHTYTHAHGQKETQDADPSTDDEISQTDGAMAAVAGTTMVSHKLDHNCTDAHGHEEFEVANAATTDPMSGTDDAMPAGAGGTVTSNKSDHNCTDDHAHEKFEHVSPASAITAPGSDGALKALVKRASPQRGTPDSMEAHRDSAAEVSSPGSQGNSRSPSADSAQDDKWIHGTCKQNKCTVTMPGENKERKADCHVDSPCLYLGSCVVSVRNPGVAFCS
ncbi:hypothetical protein BDV38DRAFT_280642 [Aspergillus pseudotamarii]|uniref:Uncharacterized protein n=1 Tax=Aspergillus pseudotamarii TaxID=132259 RepID=A0A5N6SYH1_ASPPS|nr:uncharacterized protein BDV38DRAFT_280642 [Aspergillus pseudotamarii]KAE8139726.1 hypothetical protein BDV38DRAFT_280642 [Aspergillus pseudotamarii]